MVTPAAHREAAAYLQQTYEMSQRRACRVIDGDRASVRYQARRPDDGELRERLKALAQERRRFGYRGLHVLLRREGHAVNKKRVQRLYREERLRVRQRGGRKRAMGTRRPIETPAVANQRWTLDFVADQFTDGRGFDSWRRATTAPASVWRWWPTPRSAGGRRPPPDAVILRGAHTAAHVS